MSDIAKEAMLMSHSDTEKEINKLKRQSKSGPNPQKNLVVQAKSLDSE